MADSNSSVWTTFFKVIGLVAVIVVCAGILFPIFATGSGHHPRLCISYLKQLSTGIAIYEADADDSLPPYFTFDGPIMTQKFMAEVETYTKNPALFLCPQDKAPSGIYAEGITGKMSFVHCLSMKAVIPKFDKGGRFLKVDWESPSAATTPYLRDPIRGFVASDDAKESGFLSPHGLLFYTAYLDTHVKALPHAKDERGF